MKTAVEMNHLEIANTAAWELLTDMENKLKNRYPTLSRAATNVEEIETMEFDLVYNKKEKAYDLENWVFSVRSKVGQYITTDCVFIIEELIKDRIKTEINAHLKS